jgi:hypothetical protein
MLIGDMFLDKRSRLEKLLTRLTPEFTLIFLLDVRFNGFRQFPGGIR